MTETASDEVGAAARAGTEIDVTGPGITAEHHPKTEPDPVEEHPRTGSDYLLTTDPDAEVEVGVTESGKA